VEAACEFVNSMLGGKKKSSKTDLSHITSCAGSFHAAVGGYVKDNNGAELSSWILQLPDEYCRGEGVVKPVLSQAVLDEYLSAFDCLRLLIVHWAAHVLRLWAAKV